MTHDRCLEGDYCMRASEDQAHLCCDGQLIACVIGVLASGACGLRFNPATQPAKYAECEQAARLISQGMLVPLEKAVFTCLKDDPKDRDPCLPEAYHEKYAELYWKES